MVENWRRQKRGFVSEEDISSILQRYSATTVLALLQEVAQVPDEKIDWNMLVDKTSTGISSAREYQMLWRHLAYRDPLIERLDDVGEPLDEDSDLDYELEAFPTPSPEACNEAVACVKVLIASGTPSNSSLQNGTTVEAPLILNIPNSQSNRAPSESSQLSSFMQGTNITVPVSVQKQPLPTTMSTEGLDASGSASGNLPPRRKRKPWSAAEDLELIAAVNKCGEGNWANILKGDFKSERSASQLSQRWNIIRKRKGNSSVGGGSQLSEAQLAARRAVSLALNMPMTDKLKASSSPAAGTSSTLTPSNSIHSAAEASLTGAPPQHTQQDSSSTITQRSGTLGSTPKARVTLKNPSTKPAFSPDELVKAAAVAAGARIATPSDAASLLKAAQAKNAVHIIPGGGSSIKSSVSGNTNSLPSNVHFIRTGLSTTHSSYSSVSPNATRSVGIQQTQGLSVKPFAPTVVSNPRQTDPKLNEASEVTKAASSNLVNELETKTLEDIMPTFVNASEELVQDDKGGIEASVKRENQIIPENSQQVQVQKGNNGPKEQIRENHATILSDAPIELVKEEACVSENASINPVVEGQSALASLKKFPERLSTKLESPSKIVGHDDQTGNGNDQVIDGCRITTDYMTGISNKVGNYDEPVVMDTCENANMNREQDESVAMEICQNPNMNRKQDESVAMEICKTPGDDMKPEKTATIFMTG